ncbi:hypothetical protein Bca4012_092184 [Brassica carinata]
MSAMMESLWEWICSYWILTRSSLPSKKLWSRTKNSHLTLSALPMSQSRGQLYVALSRVTSPDGLKILDDTSDSDNADGVTNIVYKEVFKGLPHTKEEHPMCS